MKRFRFFITMGMVLGSMLIVVSAEAYNYAGYRWGGSFPNIGVDTTGLNVSVWRQAASDAMTSWNNAGAKFYLTNYSPSGNTMTNYWEASDVLANARTYRSNFGWGDVYKATIRLNTYHTWNPPYTSGSWYDLRTVLRHELGHWLVLNHSGDLNTLMYYSVSSRSSKGITNDEWNGIRAIYGVR